MFSHKTRVKISGIVYGGNSRKIRNYLQISNKLFMLLTIPKMKTEYHILKLN